jgi:hypothetical protein
VNARLGLPRWKPGDEKRGRIPASRIKQSDRDDREAECQAPTEHDLLRIERAQAIWAGGQNPRGTLAEQYLASRALTLQPELSGDVLRFHSFCPWKNDKTEQTESLPCLIAPFRSIDGDTVTGLHRIRLDRPDLWPKTKRKMLGVVRGSAIKLDAITEGSKLAIAEGVETALAARQLRINPVWALGAAGAIARFAPIEGIEELTILGERDAANRKAADACALLWAQQRQRVFLALPAGGENDFNDVLMGAEK